MSDTVVIVGQCTGITEKPNGWTEFQIIVPGNRYPTKLATKLPNLVEEAREVKDAIATWTYAETESDRINPNSGKPYINRYLENVEVGTSGVPAGGSSPEPHHEPVHFADKDRLITRQTCLKAAADLYTIGPEKYAEGDAVDPPGVVLKAAERFEMWLYRDIDDVPF